MASTKIILLLVTITFSSILYAKVTCRDFASQSEAQLYMHQHQAYWLDGDKDGEACECLPGGSKYGQRICRKYYR